MWLINLPSDVDQFRSAAGSNKQYTHQPPSNIKLFLVSSNLWTLTRSSKIADILCPIITHHTTHATQPKRIYFWYLVWTSFTIARHAWTPAFVVWLLIIRRQQVIIKNLNIPIPILFAIPIPMLPFYPPLFLSVYLFPDLSNLSHFQHHCITICFSHVSSNYPPLLHQPYQVSMIGQPFQLRRVLY